MPKIQVNRVYHEIESAYKAGYTTVSEQGSSRSGKTFNTTIWLIVFLMMHPGLLLSVVRKTLPALKGSVLRDFKENLLNMGIWNDKAFNKSELIYTFPNGSQIEFFSTDDEQKIRGRKRHILYANEANELAEIEWQQLKMRTTMFSIMDYNPSFSEEHWINAVNADPRTYHFITTYKDNPFLEQTVIDEIESLKYKNKTLWQVYGLGLRAIVEGLIFKHFDIVDEVPEYAKKKRWRGVDFGYSNDETAIVDVYPYQDILYLDEICYRTEMLTSDIVQVLKANDPLVETISESADPRLVQEIYRAGINIHPVHKFPGSIEAGITKMLEYKLVVTKRSINLIKELRNYTYAQDKEGKWLNKPIDAFNHCFTGDTLITTNKGDVPIKDIKKGDIILTSSGWQSANKLFANGYKKVLDVTLVFLNFRVTIKATPEHLFKTTNGWKKLEHLTKGDVLFALSNSKGNDIPTQKYARTIAKSEDNIIRYSEIYTNHFMGLSHKEPLTMPKTEIMPMSPLKTLQQNASAEENVRIEPSLMGKLITCIRTRSITLKATKGFMSRSGSSITEKFLSAAKFITKTLIRRIMIFQTLNASRLKNTKRDIENGQVFEGEAKVNSSTLKQSEKKLKSGTKAKKAGNGIMNTESKPFSKKRPSSLNAKSAEKNTIQHSTEHDSVQISAGQSTAGSQELIMKSDCASAVEENLQLTSIQNPPFAQPLVLQDIIVNREETQQVYDIEVNNTHEYFANGVLVHNCTDAIRYVVIMKILGGKPRPVNLSKIANKAY